MTDFLTIDDFQPYLHQTFTIHLDGLDPIPLELAAITPLSEATRGPATRQPFSLSFLGPVSQQYLLQHIYRLEHPQFGDHELFLVPLGPQDERMIYEAIFA